ncbi:MAG: tRNA (adenosine(37)-N6)-threonylcarbamoyltransferase complex dimerization subunit type 1 TsaB [Dermatophilaceae bacterium]
MLLLAIDTSTTAITVALHDGTAVLAEATTLDSRAHAEHLAPGIRQALSDAGARPADVTDVVVGIGPGPFTGLRVGIVTGRTFAYALGQPVRGLCSLDALAHEAWLAGARGELLVAIDARRKEVYAAHYDLEATGLVRLAGPVVAKAADLDPAWQDLPTAGRGGLLYPEPLPHGVTEPSGIRPLDASAGALADLAVRRLALLDGSGETQTADDSLQFVDAAGGFDGLEPMYLRRPDTAPPSPSKKSTLG